MFIHIWVCTTFHLFEQIKFNNRNFIKKKKVISFCCMVLKFFCEEVFCTAVKYKWR